MTQTLIHLTHGTEQLARVTLAFQVPMAAGQQGHSVSLFLTGGAVRFLRDSTPDRVGTRGTDPL